MAETPAQPSILDIENAQLESAGHGNEQERLALMESHRADVTAELAELQENLELIDHKIDVYRGRLTAGDADQLWAPNRLIGAVEQPPIGDLGPPGV
ncbi:hypothetical protein OH799_09035 [Nocardia sp. NBC_00881]|uniref:hypothetical protein n=1 Tax=Nocardia sp. NBC_00881 TaxID=2975995 RepID=UPI00386AB53D|nr:hypothetical protein OH799_09035 [Nocardia sp. NBC_00881]